jgi:BirA family biotin operon repressor/biotin-[acetyl-CoA-carboxylase] ligase
MAIRVSHTPALPDDLAAALSRAGDRLGPFGGHVAWYPEVASTNDLALRGAHSGAPEGSLVVAEAQSQGRGRLGREWVSPAGAGVYASVLLRPDAHRSLLTLAAGVAVVEGIEAATGLRPTLKWPNDILAPSASGAARKLGGILAEGGLSCDDAPFVVVGIGINVRRSAYPPAVAARATSLEDELGRDVDCPQVLVESLAALWRRYAGLQAGRAADVLSAWSAYAGPTLGRRVEWSVDGGTRSGRVEGVDDTGALLVRTAAGVARIISGEVRWIS